MKRFSKTFSRNENSSDISLTITAILLGIFGSIMVFSAGYAYADARYDDSMYFIKRQILWLLLGFLAMYVTSKISLDFLKRLSLPIYILTIFLLLLVLIFGFVGNGAKRWISIGPVNLQPSEIAKVAIILILALYFSKNRERALYSKSKREVFVYGTAIPLALILVPILLVMLQKHLSCIIILGLIGLIMIALSGVDTRYLKFFCLIGMAGVLALALFTDYTKMRILVWQNPEEYKLTGGWQTLQGLMAIGSGGIFGVGLGRSVMKHCYVSEPANDMIFAILCEELGLLGAFITLMIFALLVSRGFIIALRSEDHFSRLVALGITLKLAIQVLLNVAVVTNTIPNTGISLPFFSYGGSSLVMLFCEMGILIAISKNAKLIK
jgi:cell division protein FtsW